MASSWGDIGYEEKCEGPRALLHTLEPPHSFIIALYVISLIQLSLISFILTPTSSLA
jgi:hypothetical protein